MQPQYPESRKKLRYLVIGRMGEGKSALCKYLTGVDSIQESPGVQSCTKKCCRYASIDRLNQKRKVQIQVIDTPGLDSKQEKLFQIMSDLLSILNQIEKINGILYVVSITSNRDQTISQFLNFLSFLFPHQQLQRSIIPILTNYDAVLFQDEKTIEQKIQSRQKAISKIWRDKQKEPINFWKNRIKWINNVVLDQRLTSSPQFKQISQNQLKDLIKMTQSHQLKAKESMDKFEQQFETKVQQFMSKSNKKLTTVKQHIESFKISAHVQAEYISLGYWIPIVGWIIFAAMLLINPDITEKAQKKQFGSQFLSKVLDKIFCKQFVRELQKRLQMKRVTPFKQRVFSYKQQQYKRHIQLKLLTKDFYQQKDKYLFFEGKQKKNQSLIQIINLQIKRIKPGPPSSCQRIIKDQTFRKTKELQFMLFKDKGQYQQVDREYELNNLIIKRPKDQYFSNMLKQMILKH